MFVKYAYMYLCGKLKTEVNTGLSSSLSVVCFRSQRCYFGAETSEAPRVDPGSPVGLWGGGARLTVIIQVTAPTPDADALRCRFRSVPNEPAVCRPAP